MSGLIAEVPGTYQPERYYIIKLLLTEFLGLEVDIVFQNRHNIRLHRNDSKELILGDVLFGLPREDWMTLTSLPVSPLKTWVLPPSIDGVNVLDRQIPVIYGDNPEDANFAQLEENKVYLGIDIFGSSFYMLTRYEEVVRKERDERGRFSAKSSLAYSEGFLLRPIVNEYLEILWWALEYLWPGMKRKRRQYSVLLSHDVDAPLCVAGNSSLRVFKSVAGDLLKRKDPVLAVDRLRSLAATRRGDIDADLCNTFDFIMDTSEQHGLKSAFYFLAQGEKNEEDFRYSLDNWWIRALMREIYMRGHEIGYHGSYSSYNKPLLIKKELGRLVKVCQEEGIVQDDWGGRQHYLRWENPVTWQGWEDAGLVYDTTLTFHDHIGFRCGTCYEYPVFNLKTRRQLHLVERPLMVMEGTLFTYMDIDRSAALELIATLASICKQFEGAMSLLWHNSSLVSKRDREDYRNVVSTLVYGR